jgi:hypothetical protein
MLDWCALLLITKLNLLIGGRGVLAAYLTSSLYLDRNAITRVSSASLAPEKGEEVSSKKPAKGGRGGDLVQGVGSFEGGFKSHPVRLQHLKCNIQQVLVEEVHHALAQTVRLLQTALRFAANLYNDYLTKHSTLQRVAWMISKPNPCFRRKDSYRGLRVPNDADLAARFGMAASNRANVLRSPCTYLMVFNLFYIYSELSLIGTSKSTKIIPIRAKSALSQD